MGDIINTKTSGDKVIYKIEVPLSEAIQLRNHMKKVHAFVADLCDKPTGLIERGSKGGAKYFKIPLSLKSRKKAKFNKTSYQKIEVGERVYYICTAEKDPLA